MANPHHVALLERSVALFNAYRARHPGERIDLQEAVFHDRDFPGVDLRGADLRRSSWRGVNLAHADLTDVRAALADFEGAILRGANVSRTEFLHADLGHVDLCAASGLESAELTGTEYAR